MPDQPNITQIIPPRVPLIDERTGQINREWYRYFYNLYYATGGTNGGATPVNRGGTGTTVEPANGQLLIGNGTTKAYYVNDLDTGPGIAKTVGAGTLEIENTGVLSFSADNTGLTPATPTTGDVVLDGVLNETHGGTNQSSYVTGDLLYASATNTLSKLADVAAGNTLLSGGVATAPAWGKVQLSSSVTPNHVTGTLQPGNGGTGQTTYSNGQLLIGNGTGLSKSTLTAGANITITNGAGSITISAAGYTPSGASGSFTTADTPAKTVTVVDGVVTSIV